MVVVFIDTADESRTIVEYQFPSSLECEAFLRLTGITVGETPEEGTLVTLYGPSDSYRVAGASLELGKRSPSVVVLLHKQ